MKRKQNTEKTTVVTTDAANSAPRELNPQALELVSGGTGSSHRHWSDWSKWQ